MMKRVFIVLFVLTRYLFCQVNSLTLTSRADGLMDSLIAAPGKTALQYQLVEEYLHHACPELALLELMDLEKNTKLTDEGLYQKGRILFLLGQTKLAARELIRSYLNRPDAEKLKFLIAADYMLGNENRSRLNFQYMKENDPNTGNQFVAMAKEFYATDKGILAASVLAMIKSFDPALYAKEFPLPIISILSPEKNQSTEGQEQVLTFQISHARAVNLIRVDNVDLYKTEQKGAFDDQKIYNESFTHKVRVNPGKNVYKIKASDVYGYESIDSISLYGLGFDLSLTKKPDIIDTLRRRTEYLSSFIPENEITSKKSNDYKLLTFVFNNSSDSAIAEANALACSRLLCNGFTGFVNEAEEKLLLKTNAGRENLESLASGWLRKKLNFQSKLVFYFSGSWVVDPLKWDIKTTGNEVYDVKNLIKGFTEYASAGVYVIVDGIADRVAFAKEAARFAEGVKVPFALIITEPGHSYAEVIERLTNADSTHGTSDESEVTALNINQIIASSVITGKDSPRFSLFNSPAQAIRNSHKRFLETLSIRLKEDKVPVAQRTKIETYCADWRRNLDIRRYLGNQLSLADLIVKVDEYNTRITMQGGVK